MSTEAAAATAADRYSAAFRRLLEVNAQLMEKTQQLETALASRIVIEQAKGVLAERHRVEIPAAFDALRRGARSSQTRLHALAHRVVDEPGTPPEIARYLR